MPKPNPKHSKAHLDRQQANSVASTKKILNIFSPPMLYKSPGIKFSPKIPTEAKIQQIHRKNQSSLFQLESKILSWYDQNALTDNTVILNALGEILSYPNETPPPSSLLTAEERILNLEIRAMKTQLFTSNSSINTRKYLDCIGCLYFSVNFWVNQNGPSGYTDYISNFIPLDLTDQERKRIGSKFAKSPPKKYDSDFVESDVDDAFDLDSDSDFDFDPDLDSDSNSVFDSNLNLNSKSPLNAFDQRDFFNFIDPIKKSPKKTSRGQSSTDRRILTQDLARSNTLEQSSAKKKYSNTELIGYESISDAIFKFIPSDPFTNPNLSRDTLLKKYVPKIEIDLNRALECLPQLPEIYHALLALQLFKKDLKSGQKYYSDYVAKGLLADFGRQLYGMLLVEHKLFQEALDLFNSVEKPETKANLLAMQANVYSQMGDLDTAIHYYQLYKKKNRKETWVDLEIAKLHLIQTKNAEPGGKPIQQLHVNSFNFWEFVATSIYALDDTYFNENQVLQTQLLKRLF